MFSGKLQQKELEWQSDQAQLRSSFSKEKAELEAQLKSAKLEEGKLKDKLLEAESVSVNSFQLLLSASMMTIAIIITNQSGNHRH